MLQAMDDGIYQFSRQFENSATGPDAAAVQAVAAHFATALAALPTAFVSTAAPGLIAASGLTMLD